MDRIMADLIIKNPNKVDSAKLTSELSGIALGVTQCPDTLTIHKCTDDAQAMEIYNAHIAILGADGLPIAVSVQSDSGTIIGDGVDEITLTVRGVPNALVGVTVQTGATISSFDVQLDDNGLGTQAFSCETSPTVIVFSSGGVSCKVRAL
jgi:hypothetical protein